MYIHRTLAILQASQTPSTPSTQFVSVFACRVRRRKTQFGGVTLQFPDIWATERGLASCWTFSRCSAGSYRLHSGGHYNRMLYFLGRHAPREWVIWDAAVPVNGAWETVEIVWKEDDTKFKIKGHDDQWVKWAVACFVSTSKESEATEFILCKA